MDELEDKERELRRGSGFEWPVGDSYRIREGILTWVGDPERARSYFPFADPTLPPRFARLKRGDEGQVLAFAKEFGLVGYRDLLAFEHKQGGISFSELKERYRPGDPLNWIWQHSETARRVLDLIRARDSGSEDEVYEVMSDHIDPRVSPAVVLKPYAEGPFGEGGRHQRAVVIGDFSARFVSESLAEILNANLKYLETRVIYRPERDEISRSYEFPSLIPVIYSFLADAVSSTRSYHRCDYCLNYFLETHGRQRYCPHPVNPDRESLCSINYRQRKRRLAKP